MQACAVRLQGVHFGEIRVEWLFLGLLASLGFQGARAVRAQEQVLVEVGEEWRYFKGTQAPPANWASPGFNDADAPWLSGVTGIGYGDGDDATILGDMRKTALEPGYAAFFARRTFSVPDIAAVNRLVLSVDYDDGFVAYLNGAEAARRGLGNPGDPVAFDQVALGHDAVVDGGFVDFIVIDTGKLVGGQNVLAIELHNSSIDSSDASLIPRLVANGSLPPTGLKCARSQLTPGTVDLVWTNSINYDSIRVVRNGAPIGTVAGIATVYNDLSPTPLDNAYSVVGVLSGTDFPSTTTCVDGCTQSTITCHLSLANGSTQANLSWTPIPGLTSTTIARKGAVIATLSGGETSYVDPNVEIQMPAEETGFTVTQTNGAGETCTLGCQLSLCPENLTGKVVNGRVQLGWENLVKVWDHFEISVNGAVVDPAVPGNATSWTDTKTVLALGNGYSYVLHPVAPASGALPAPATQCDQDVSLAYVPEVGSYDPPPGGWDYVLKFSGSGKPQYNPNLGQTGNLDGRWIRSIDRDLWNGSGPDDPVGPAPVGPAPGGVDIVSRPGLGPCGSDTSVLRILDPGDTSLPIGTEFPAPFDPPNNSRILLGLDLGTPTRNLLKAGITFSARLRTSPDAPAFMKPNPASGDGAALSNGIGQVGVYFRAAGTVPEEGPTAGAGFSLQSGGNGGDLQLSTNPRTEIKAVGALKFIEIYMTVRGGANPGTYDVNAYINGATTTSSTVGGSQVSLQAGATDFGTIVNNYLAIGFNGTSDDAMIEIDYVAYKLGIFPPSVTPCRGGFHRGDSNNDGKHNISDAVNTLSVLFLGLGSISCQEAADSNDDGRVNIADPINSLGVLFLGVGNIPPPAVPELGACGPDPTPDGLGCASYTNC